MALAVVLAVSLTAMAVAWLYQGDHRGRLIDIDRAGPVRIEYKVD